MTMIYIAATDVATRMLPGSVHALAFWQAQDAINSGNAKLITVFIVIAGIALFAQAIAVVGVALGAWKAQKAIMGHVLEIKAKVMPLIEKSHNLVTDLTPEVKQITGKVNTLVTDLSPEIKLITTKVHEISVKVEAITAHFEEIAEVAKDKVHEFAPTISAAKVTADEANETVRAANQKTREQIDRVNGMVSGALDATAQMGAAIQHAITTPVKEVAGMVNNAKASIGTMIEGAKQTVGTASKATGNFFEAVVNGAKGMTANFFAPKRRPAVYRAPVGIYEPRGLSPVEAGSYPAEKPELEP